MDIHVRNAWSRCQSLLTLAALATTLAGQQASASQQQANAPAKDEPSTAGLPPFLLKVPAGSVAMGLTVEQWLQIARESVSPHKPELADREPKKMETAFKQTGTELGRTMHSLPTFLLGRSPVTNLQFEAWLLQMQKQGKKVRPPFHWWRYGRKDDYDKRLEDINKQFKADGKMGPVMYWERYGPDLPYALRDDKGKDISDHPVVYVTKKEAVQFAGWLGMRLPSESEFTRAARGDGQNLWAWGQRQCGDHFVEAILEQLGYAKASDRRTRPVGSHEFYSGPFGHTDMNCHIWQYTSTVGLLPINGQKPFEAEWKELQKDKVASKFSASPLWKDAGVIVKGGSYLFGGNPIEFHLDSRVLLQTDDVLEAVGFRLAKDLRPGYDLLVSLVESDYNQDLFQTGVLDQRVDFEAQAGIERYVLDPKTGFPTAYYAVSMAPVDWLTTEKGSNAQKLEEKSHHAPVLLGTFVTTEPILQPKLAPAIYSVAFRKAGIPKELRDAWSAGYKEVQALIKKGESIDAKPEDSPEGGKEGKQDKSDWRTVLKKFGLTAKDLEPKEAKEVNLVRYDTFEVPVDSDVFLFHDNNGKYVAFARSTGLSPANVMPATITVGQAKVDKQDHMKVELEVRVPVLKGQPKGVEYKLELILDQGPPAADTPWRIPQAP